MTNVVARSLILSPLKVGIYFFKYTKRKKIKRLKYVFSDEVCEKDMVVEIFRCSSGDHNIRSL